MIGITKEVYLMRDVLEIITNKVVAGFLISVLFVTVISAMRSETEYVYNETTDTIIVYK
jgi:hypothetical protein